MRELHAKAKKHNIKHSLGIALKFILAIDPTRDLNTITKEEVKGVLAIVSRLRVIYKQMKANCYSPNAQLYRFYGGKGVTICEEWLKDSDSFVAWAMKNGYRISNKKRGVLVSRRDCAKEFGPSNCEIKFND